MSYKDAKGCLPGVANPLDSPPKEIFLHKYDVLEDNHYLHLHVWSAMRLADDDVRYVLAPPEPIAYDDPPYVYLDRSGG